MEGGEYRVSGERERVRHGAKVNEYDLLDHKPDGAVVPCRYELLPRGMRSDATQFPHPVGLHRCTIVDDTSIMERNLEYLAAFRPNRDFRAIDTKRNAAHSRTVARRKERLHHELLEALVVLVPQSHRSIATAGDHENTTAGSAATAMHRRHRADVRLHRVLHHAGEVRLEYVDVAVGGAHVGTPREYLAGEEGLQYSHIPEVASATHWKPGADVLPHS